MASGAAWMVALVAMASQWKPEIPFAITVASTMALSASLVLFFFYPITTALYWKFQWNFPTLLTLFFGILLTFIVSLLAIKFSFHDQMRLQAHPPLIESLLRGNIPPHMMAFPSIQLKYHWGADLFGAIACYVTGLPAYRAIDITMIFGWITLYGCLYTFCKECGLSSWWTLLALIWVPLAAGWAYLLKSYIASPEALAALNFDWPDSKRAFGRHLNPGNISNFFMTPSSLGLPVFFAYLSLLTVWLRRHLKGGLALAAFLLGALSLIQVTYFITALTSTLLTLALLSLKERTTLRTLFGRLLLIILAAMGLALILGGFFIRDSGYDPQALILNWPPGYLRNATWGREIPINGQQAFIWYLSNFGSALFIFLPASIGILWSIKKDFRPISFFLLMFALQCLVVAQFFRYKYTWDIIKWFSGLHTAILLLTILWVSSRFPKRRWMAIALTSLMILDIIPSIRFLYHLGFSTPSQVLPSQRAWWKVVIPPPSPAMNSLIALLKSGLWNEQVLSTVPLSQLLAGYTGQAMTNLDINTIYFGVSPQLIQQRKIQIGQLARRFTPESMQAFGVSWLIFSCQDFKDFFSEESRQGIQRAVENGQLEELSMDSSSECFKTFHFTSH